MKEYKFSHLSKSAGEYKSHTVKYFIFVGSNFRGFLKIYRFVGFLIRGFDCLNKILKMSLLNETEMTFHISP